MANDYDIVIVGGGMVGASMACALESTDFSIAVIESFQADSQQQPSFDERTVALTYSSKLIFDAMNVWQDIAPQASPITDIEVTNQDSFGFTTLGTADSGTGALGYVVPTRLIGSTLHQRIKNQANVELFCPATVASIESYESGAITSVDYQGNTESINAKLIILADGGRSGLMEHGFGKKAKAYTQSALVAIVGTDKPHNNKAYEHFTDDGPLALLPLRQSDYALAWTLNKDQAESLAMSDQNHFTERLQVNFGKRAGRFLKVGRRHVYPLQLSILDKPYNKRMVVIGNAAHTVHPVAGQGFNLGLRDVGFLYQILSADGIEDPGATALLDNYHQLRRRDTKAVGYFTDGLIGIFTSEFFGMKTARNLGLSMVNLLPGVKKALLKRTMGLHGRQSILALKGKQTGS